MLCRIQTSPRLAACPWRASGLAALFALAGCRKEEEKRTVVPLEGKVERIALKSDGTGEITVSYTDKQQRPATGTGLVTTETDIMINGAVATLKDIREGDRVRGEVRMDKKGDERKLVALRIRVERAQPVGDKAP